MPQEIDLNLCPECGNASGVLRHVVDEQDKTRLIRECPTCLHAWEPATQELADFGDFNDVTEYPEGVDDIPDEEIEVFGVDLAEPDDEPTIVLSGQQDAAANGLMSWFQQCQDEIEAFGGMKQWLACPNDERPDLSQPVFRIFGYAGTGKTTMTKEAIRRLDLSNVPFMAFTGKAALVMTKHGTPAATIHSSIYTVQPEPESKIRGLERKIKDSSDPAEVKELRAQLKEAQQPKFVFNPEGAPKFAELLVLDEVSMVGVDLGQDLMRYKVPILVLGDPGQLPPIEGAGFFTEKEPDFLLDEIRRQAAGNPIIDFATKARMGLPIPFGIFENEQGQAIRGSQRMASNDILMQADQILCGKNATRRTLNNRIREILGHAARTHLPVKGDKLICLKNNRDEGLFNGLFAEVVEVGEMYDNSIDLTLRLETDAPDAEPKTFECLREHFDVYVDKEAPNRTQWYDRKRCQEFDFGYAITVHKAQGSQWENVLLWDDKMFAWRSAVKERRQWLYTAVTRAASGFVMVD